VAEALQLLARPGIRPVVVAGGTSIVPRFSDTVEEVIDLQAVVGLADITETPQGLSLGVMTTLQGVVANEWIPHSLREAAHREGPNTFRNAGTVGGAILSPSQESEFVATLLVFEAAVSVQTSTGGKTIALAELLKDIPAALDGGLLTTVIIAAAGPAASARVARTPADQPIVAAIARRGADGSVKLALCGVAATPVLVDAAADVKAAINPPADFRGSTEYRRQMAATLAKRVITELEKRN
jgi:CO/xanthine dehydrogenase FAD-binding subunit